MGAFVLSTRRSLIGSAVLAVLLLINGRAEAQGIGFQGGVSVDPEQVFVGTHFETGELFQNFRFRPGIDGGFGGDFSLATINIEFLYHVAFGRSGWSVYQGGGPPLCCCASTTIRACTPAASSPSVSLMKTDSSRISRSAPATRRH